MSDPPTPFPPPLDAAQLAARVRAKRTAEGLSVRAAAAALGMSASTLSRVESGGHLPQRDHLLRLAAWAGMPLDAAAGGARPVPVHREDASTVEAIELHLRADRDLSPEDAELLVQLVRTAYEQLNRRRA